MQQIKLSIIMPCYNVADTINRAMDSILFQKVNFDYEIIIIDDASTDNTIGIVSDYAKKYKHIRILKNEENQGNAWSFYKGLESAQGEYFCVLDGDDYYTISDKLQKQVSFFESDVQQEYIAVAHHFVIDLGNGEVNVSECKPSDEFNYVDFMTQNAGYFHTTTYMYRNIFRGNIPEYYKSKVYRGDTPRTTFHLMYSNKKVKILNFVGSAYTFSFNGIWSGLKEKEQFEYQINYLNNHKKVLHTDFEKKCVNKLIDGNTMKLNMATDSHRKYPSATLDECIKGLQRYTGVYAFEEKEFMLSGLYYSEYVDSLCATLGYIYQIYNIDSKQTEVNENNICIVIGKLNPNGGGIFREIEELTEMYSDKKVYIVVTNMKTVGQKVSEIFDKHKNVSLICPPEECCGKLAFLFNAFKGISPFKSYFYTSHDDTYATALIQLGPCKNICLFSFDHGYICGISNPNLDCIIAKRPVDYGVLKKKFGDKVIYIPTWNQIKKGYENLKYKPFCGHNKLITASGAARFYKIDGGQPYSYIDIILDLLNTTKGVHYHFGPIPIEKICYIKEYLAEHLLDEDAFVHIEWAENLPKEMLEKHIDVFIEPFPVVSYKFTLDILSCGIPVFAYDGIKRLTTIDFIYKDSLLWRTKEEFVKKLSTIRAEELSDHSKRSIKYFNETHLLEKVKPFLINEKEFCKPEFVNVVDNIMQDIRGYHRLFGNTGKINLMTVGSVLNRGKITKPITNSVTVNISKKNIKSVSYRIGYIIMWVLRTLKTFFAMAKNEGCIKSFRFMRVHDYLENCNMDFQDVLKRRLNMHRNSYLVRVLLIPYKFHKSVTRILKKFNAKKKAKKNSNSEMLVHMYRQVAYLCSKQKSQMEILSEMQKQFCIVSSDKQQAIQSDLSKLSKSQSNLANIARQNNSELSMLSQTQKKIANVARQNNRVLKEVAWAEIYNNTVQNSRWLVDKTFSPGRWAVGYPFLYVLYRTLDQIMPTKILEMGLGQSTRMITQYAEFNTEVKHLVIEQNEEWKKFFLKSIAVSKRTQIILNDYSFEPYNGVADVRVFDGLPKKLRGERFNLICVDAPSAENMIEYSRIDILKMLPVCLEKTFVIFLDDCNRKGENNTASEIDRILTENSVEFSTAKYTGEKEFRIWCSKDVSFLCSL